MRIDKVIMKRKKVPFYRCILFKVCIIIFVAMLSTILIGAVITYQGVKREDEVNILSKAQSFVNILHQGFTDDGTQWLLDYWEAHCNEMNLLSRKETEDEKVFDAWMSDHEEAKDFMISNMQYEISAEELKEMSDQDQLLLAEYVYDAASHSFDTATLYEGRKATYTLFKLIDTDEGEKEYLYFSNKTDEPALGKVEPISDIEHLFVKNILQTGYGLDSLEYFISPDGVLYMYTACPVILNDKVVAIEKLEYPWSETRSELLSQTAEAIKRIVVYIIICEIIIILLLFFMIIRPVRKLQEKILDYTKDKDASGCEKGLLVLNKRKDEVGSLARDVTNMTKEMDRYISEIYKFAEEKADSKAALSVAAKIQRDMLPCRFPAFPDRDDFCIFASMTPAKEVGGDFYDFFLLDDDHLGMVIADVSEKGIPASLFMVISKTLIKDHAQMCRSPKTILEEVNNKLCESNGEGMFVTVWLGILTISTGKIVAANAGHEFPAIRKANGEFELFQDEHGFVLGCMKDMKYNEYEMELEKGGCLFLYTDGVPEATNANDELFGTDRMLEALNKDPKATPGDILDNVKKATDEFVGDAPQFDDLTMMAVTLK